MNTNFIVPTNIMNRLTSILDTYNANSNTIIENIDVAKIENNNEKKITCDYCEKKFSSKSGKWYHIQKCNKQITNININEENENLKNQLTQLQNELTLIKENKVTQL